MAAVTWFRTSFDTKEKGQDGKDESPETPENGIQSEDFDRLGGWAALIAAMIAGLGAFLMILADADFLVIILISILIFGVTLGAAFYALKFPKSFIGDVLQALFRHSW